MNDQFKNSKKDVVAGLIIILINILWIWGNLDMLLSHSGLLSYVASPEWTLVLNSVLGLIGITFGLGLILHKLTLKTGITSSALLIIMGKLIQFLAMM